MIRKLFLVLAVAAALFAGSSSVSMLDAATAKNPVILANEDPGGGCEWSCHITWTEWHPDGLYQCDAGFYAGTWYFWGCFKL